MRQFTTAGFSGAGAFSDGKLPPSYEAGAALAESPRYSSFCRTKVSTKLDWRS